MIISLYSISKDTSAFPADYDTLRLSGASALSGLAPFSALISAKHKEMRWSRTDSCSEIIAQESHVDTRYRASSLPSTTVHGRRTRPWVSFLAAIAEWRANLAPALYKTRVSLRNFRGRTGILFSKGGMFVDLGASCLERNGCYVGNKRTTACAEGIERLRATHPWVDSQDLRIFLMGFASGEEYSKTVLTDQNTPESLSEQRRTPLVDRSSQSSRSALS